MNDDIAKQLSKLTGRPIPNNKKKSSKINKNIPQVKQEHRKVDQMQKILGIDFPRNSKMYLKIKSIVIDEKISSFTGSLKATNSIDTILGIKQALSLSKIEASCCDLLREKLALIAFDYARNEYRLGLEINMSDVEKLSALASKNLSKKINVWLSSPPEKRERNTNILKEKKKKEELKKALHEAEIRQREESISKAWQDRWRGEELSFQINNLSKEQKERERLKMQYIEMKLNILKSVFPNSNHKTKFHTSFRNLDSNDYSLAAKWYKNDRSNIQITNLLNYLKACPHNGMLQLSARNSEKIAIKFYENLGNRVNDIAYSQLDFNEGDWMQYDLKVDNRFIDVKNARRPYKNPSNYSEQFVKKFKYKNNQEISYLGVLSDYQTAEKAKEQESYDVTVLGEINESDIEIMTNFVDVYFDGLFQLSFSSKNDKHFSNEFGKKGFFIPGWMFDYHKDFYKDQISDELIDLKIKELNDFNAQHKLKNEYFSLDFKSDEIGSFIVDVQSKYNINRRILFLMILGYSLQKATKKDPNYRPSHWIKHCFIEHHKSNFHFKQWPMRRFDPEEYIFNFIQILEGLWDYQPNPLMKYDSFYLQRMNILKGKHHDGLKETIYAYCGGWNLDKSLGPCGTNPLIQGQNMLCKSCKLLICNNCFTCYEECPENIMRRKAALEDSK